MGKKKKRQLRQILLPVILSVILICLIFITYQIILADKFYPITHIGDINVSFLTKGQAIKILSFKLDHRLRSKVDFEFEGKMFTINLVSASARIDYSILDDIFENQHTPGLMTRLSQQLKSLSGRNYAEAKIDLTLDKYLDQIASSVYKEAQNATLTYDETTTKEGSPSANIQIQEGKNGIELDKDTLKAEIKKYLNYGAYNNLLSTKIIPPKVTTQHLEKAKKVLEDLQNRPISLHFQTNTLGLDAKQLLTILDLTEGADLLNKDQAYLYIQKIAKDIDQKVAEGQFEFNAETKKVAVFKPSQEGRKLDQNHTYLLIRDALENQIKDIDLPVNIVKPKVETSQVNNLGIKELIGRGISNFALSIPNRIYNVNLTAAKINGVLVPPGEIFSFNQTIGDISAATGFKQAYVIKEGRTVLDDGGGVCQDSTTLFRAVLNAGLPVVKRTAHAYRVGYYEQGFPPGLDATVFYPSVDFQFKNDTASHILIQAYTTGTTLFVDLYGTNDGRVVNMTKPVIRDSTPPPPELRQDDPTLPKGTVKQVDWAAWGAKVSFTRTVTRGGENIIKETWNSNYKPWQAVYLVGTQ